MHSELKFEPAREKSRMERIEKLIFNQAELRPDALAISCNGVQLSYAELREQSLLIGAELRGLGLKPGGAVLICQEKSAATIPQVLGIWAAGGVVVPISPNTPDKMLEWLIQDASPSVIITDKTQEERVKKAANIEGSRALPTVSTTAFPGNGHYLERTRPFGAPQKNGEHAAEGTHPADTCYVMYTSGSQGHPKGVIGSHRSLLHYLRWQARQFDITESDRFSQVAPLSFDFSLKEFLCPLISGASVHIADRTVVLNSDKFVDWVADSRISVMCCVPTLARSILQIAEGIKSPAFESLRHVLISGDMLRWEDVLNWRKHFGDSIGLFNLYGPTESTVIKLFYPIPLVRCKESVNVPVGRPISETEILVVDPDDRPCSSGQVGEVIILSDWIANGYLHAGHNGQSSFCHVDHNGKQTRAYRTGDLGRLLSSGDLELVGRKDRQVKIRGYRIELDEIESILAEHPAIADVAAVVVNDSGDADHSLAEIVCYFSASGADATEKEVRSYARERLPSHVISLTRFVLLDQLPLSANGKVDRLKLASFSDNGEGKVSDQTAPAKVLTVGQRIRGMWEELLGVDGIDADANFFELGGDSMTAIRLLRRLREEMHSEIKLSDLYEFPIVSQLSARVEHLLNLANSQNLEEKS